MKIKQIFICSILLSVIIYADGSLLEDFADQHLFYRGATTTTSYEVCPNPANIVPCVCLPSVDGLTADIDCSLVESEDELENVFSTSFPLINLRGFQIHNNFQLTSLTRNVFGQVTFQYFYINTCVINLIESSVFDNFDYQMEAIEVSYTKISDNTFPFSKLSELQQLTTIYFVTDSLYSFPLLNSLSLEFVDLNGNYLSTLRVTAFANAESVTNIELGDNDIALVDPNTFVNLRYLEEINLHGNSLSIIDSFTFSVPQTTKTIDLSSNEIFVLRSDGFEGFEDGLLDLGSNQIATLSEVNFGPLLQRNNTLYVNDNPLICGCDMAWVFNNATLWPLISDREPTCKNGTLLEDLNPNFFLRC